MLGGRGPSSLPSFSWTEGVGEGLGTFSEDGEFGLGEVESLCVRSVRKYVKES